MTERDWKLEYHTQKRRADGLQRSRDDYMKRLNASENERVSALKLANRWWQTLISIATIVNLEDHSRLSEDLPAKVQAATRPQR